MTLGYPLFGGGRGQLGAFIKAIETGRVKEGSYLLVESLDRLSHKDVIDAPDLFLKIIRAGINNG